MKINDPKIKTALSFLALFALVYLSVGILAYFFAESLIFQPQPSSYSISENIIKLPSGDAQIAAIHLKNPDAVFTILFSHGNAEDIGHLMPLLTEIKNMGFSVLAYDYQGYGKSSGQPTETNTYDDVNAAYHYLTDKLNIPPSKIIVHGRSLGGALAVDLASRKPVGGLIVESSFVSAYRVMTRISLYPFDQYKSISKIMEVNCPVLIMHGKQDRVISFWHGEALFSAAKEPKMKLWVDSAGHNDLFFEAGAIYRQALYNFIELIKE